jgi:PAS domain S-box-containing protein
MNKDQSLELFQRLIEHMNEAVWVGDENEKTIYANPKFCELVEFELDEIKGWESYKFWDEESTNRVKNVNTTDRVQGQSSSYEGVLISQSGKRIPVLLNGSPLPGGGTVGIMTDLRELQANEHRYTRLIENMNEAVWMGDKDEITVYANPKFCALMEMTLEEMLGRPSYDFWDEESAQKVKNVNTNKRKNGESSSYEGQLLNKSGKIIPVWLSGTALRDGGTIGIMTDLRELKAKQESEQTLGKAIEMASDTIIIFDTEGKVKTWNAGARQIFGYKKEEVLNSSLQSMFEGDEINSIFTNTVGLQKLKLHGRHKNNHKFTISATVTPIQDEHNKKLAYCLLIGQDITNQARVEFELSQRYQRIQEVYTEMGVQRRQMDYIQDLVNLAKKGVDRTDIAEFVSKAMLMLSGVDACVVRNYCEEKNSLKLLAYVGNIEGWQGKSYIDYKASLAEKAFAESQPQRVMDIAQEPRYQSVQLARANNLFSLMLIPLSVGSQKIGTISLYAKAEKTLEIFENPFIEDYAGLVALLLNSPVQT